MPVLGARRSISGYSPWRSAIPCVISRQRASSAKLLPMTIFRSLACLPILAVAIPLSAQQEGPSLGDVARQNQAAKKAEPEHVFTDQGNKAAIPTAPVSLCGEPLPIMQTTYAAAFAGQVQLQPSDEEL